jgi:CubicO group peptidase (beta-lactamase class C family)
MPEGVDPEKMADFGWMTSSLAAMEPLFEPGTTNAYHCYTQGWLSAELIQRTDANRRSFRQFIHEEIIEPLGIADIWFGLPEAQETRAARLYGPGASNFYPSVSLFMRSIPREVDTSPEVWELPIMRRACIPGAGAHVTAQSAARFWAMLAQGGTLDGFRLLSAEHVRSFSVPRPDTGSPTRSSASPTTSARWAIGCAAPSLPWGQVRICSHRPALATRSPGLIQTIESRSRFATIDSVTATTQL